MTISEKNKYSSKVYFAEIQNGNLPRTQESVCSNCHNSEKERNTFLFLASYT